MFVLQNLLTASQVVIMWCYGKQAAVSSRLCGCMIKSALTRSISSC